MLALPTCAWSQPGATNAAPGGGAAAGAALNADAGASQRGRDGRPGRDRGRDRTPPTEAEWREAAETMKALAPLAWARFEAMPRQAPHRAKVMRRIVDRHQELARLKTDDPKRYEGEVEQLRVEDEILGLVIKFRQAAGAEAASLERQLREKVGQLVDLRFRNREARIDRLARSLEDERRRFEADKKNREQIIERRFKGVINGPMGRRGFSGDPGRGGRGHGLDAPAETPAPPGGGGDPAPKPEPPQNPNPGQ